MLSTGALLADRFRIESSTASGGMGIVYRAIDIASGRPVAVKVRLGGLQSDVEGQRFAREAQLLAELEHPAIVAYVAHGVTEGQPYIVMEWLDGLDLADRLASEPLTVDESLVVARRAAGALAEAHRRGVIHRDLKPSNLFLRGGAVEGVTLLDFGIARRATGPAMTRTGVALGTPEYMAPEQAGGEREIGPAADVFALGCVLFECLTGRPPFTGEYAMNVLAKVLFEEAPRLRSIRPDLPEALDALLGRMLEKDPSRRPRDASAVHAELSAVDASGPRPVPVGPTSTTTLGGSDELIVSVVIASPSSPPAEAASIALAGTTMLTAEHRALCARLVANGARVEPLADGSLVVTVTTGARLHSVTDLVTLAARCALLVREHWPSANIALATGRGKLRGKMPVGQVIDRAASLVHEGKSSEIVLDGITAGLLDARFRVDAKPSGRFVLDGASDGVADDETRPLLGKPTPCVGREIELGTLDSTLAACLSESAPRGILVTAPPGGGKSRLRHEFLRRVRSSHGDVLVLFSRGDPLGAGASFGMLAQLVRQLVAIADGDPLATRREKLLERVGQLVPGTGARRVAEFIGEMCGVPFPDDESVKLNAARQDPRVMSDQIRQAWLDLLGGLCARHPVLLVLEDLHWGDALTVKLLELALRTIVDAPLMVLALARPEVDSLIPRTWGELVQVIPLRPLGKRAAEQLIRQVLGPGLAPAVVARIVEQSAGNGLFLEELIRAAAEGKGDELPETVLAVLQGRIGALETEARRVLSVASVFGASSSGTGIKALLPDTDVNGWLGLLVQHEILERRLDHGDDGYRFRHALVRDAAYALLADEERCACHRAVGEYLERTGESELVTLAEHHRRGRAWEDASRCYLRAAEQAAEAKDLAATLAHADRGLACGAEREAKGALLALKAGAYFFGEDLERVIEAGREALDLLPAGGAHACRVFQVLLPATAMLQRAELAGDVVRRFMSTAPEPAALGPYVRAAPWLIAMFNITGACERSRELLARTEQLAITLGPSDRVAWGSLRGATGSYAELIAGDPWQSYVACQESCAALAEGDDIRNLLIMNVYYAKSLSDIGKLSDSEALLRKNLRHAEDLGEELVLMYARVYLARFSVRHGPLEGLEDASALLRSVLSAKNVMLAGLAHGCLGEMHARRDELEQAESSLRTACETLRIFPAYRWEIEALLATVLLRQDRPADALALAEASLAEMAHLRCSGYGEISVRLAVAESSLALGRRDAGRAALEAAERAIQDRARRIPEPADQQRYLTAVPENARVIEQLAALG